MIWGPMFTLSSTTASSDHLQASVFPLSNDSSPYLPPRVHPTT